MSSVLSIVTAPLELFIRLRDEIIRYQTSRKARERLFNALNYEVKVYNDIIDRISDLGKKDHSFAKIFERKTRYFEI